MTSDLHIRPPHRLRRRYWLFLAAAWSHPRASDLPNNAPLLTERDDVQVVAPGRSEDAPMEIHWHHPSGKHAVLGKCSNVPPLHGANCHPLATARVMEGAWDCARLLSQSESEGGDTMNVDIESGFCQVQRCGPAGRSPLAQMGGLHVPYSTFHELRFDMEVYSFRCAEPRQLLKSTGDGSSGLRFDDVDKYQDYWTTSRDFKRDLRQFFGPMAAPWTVLELGSYHGQTSRVLSEIFKQVIAVDASDVFLGRNKMTNEDRNNIMYVRLHTRLDDLDILRHNDIPVVMVDAEHDYESVRMDVQDVLKVLEKSVQYLIFDDYGTDDGVHEVVSEQVREGRLEILGGIGKKPPWKYHDKIVKTWEGVVCKVLAARASPSEDLSLPETSTEGAIGCMLDRTYYWMTGSMMCNKVQIRLEANGEAKTTRGVGRWYRDKSHEFGIWFEWPSEQADQEPRTERWYLGFEERCEKFAAAVPETGNTAAGVSEGMLETMLRRVFVSVNHEFCNSANECELRQKFR
mmetsp:Transcript_2864/g.5555  ORF Transcript_2864/g.5555 Transcript_2864/m.5555 type:complete len:516 (-) Transcript_2864:8-1555(-)